MTGVNDAQKLHILLDSLSATPFIRLVTSCRPKQPKDFSLFEILEKLRKRYTVYTFPKAQIAKFFAIKQKPGESLHEFSEALHDRYIFMQLSWYSPWRQPLRRIHQRSQQRRNPIAFDVDELENLRRNLGACIQIRSRPARSPTTKWTIRRRPKDPSTSSAQRFRQLQMQKLRFTFPQAGRMSLPRPQLQQVRTSRPLRKSLRILYEDQHNLHRSNFLRQSLRHSTLSISFNSFRFQYFAFILPFQAGEELWCPTNDLSLTILFLLST